MWLEFADEHVMGFDMGVCAKEESGEEAWGKLVKTEFRGGFWTLGSRIESQWTGSLHVIIDGV